MDFIGLVILFILVATVVVLGVLGVGAYFLLGAFLRRGSKHNPPLSPEEQALKLVNGHRDPIRFFGEAGLSRAIRERAGNRCEHEERGNRCTETNDLQLDHIYPWFHGGWTILGNAQVLCTRHNQDKGADIPNNHELFMIEMRRTRTFKDGMLMPKGSLGVYWKPNEEEKAYRLEWLKTNKPFVHVPGQFKR